MRPETCPNCGAEVPRGARACPDCGADERTGWSEGAEVDRLGLPSSEFDYETFIREELSEQPKSTRPLWWWMVIALLLLALLGWWMF